MFRKRMNFLLVIMLVLQIVEAPLMKCNLDKLYAINDSRNKNVDTPLSFDLYDKVYASYGGRVSTVVDNRDNQIKTLTENAEEPIVNFSDANSFVSQKNNGETDIMVDKSTAYIRFLKKYSNFYSLPLKGDLEMVTEGDNLSSNIPEVDSNWFLGEAPVDNTIQYVTGNNSFIGDGQKLKDADIVSTGTTGQYRCSFKDDGTTPIGTGLYEASPDADKTFSVVKKRSVVIKNYKALDRTFWSRVKNYSTSDSCAGSGYAPGVVVANAKGTVTWENGIWSTSGDNLGYVWVAFQSKMGFYSISDKTWFFNLQKGDVERVNITRGGYPCITLDLSASQSSTGARRSMSLPVANGSENAYFEFEVADVVETTQNYTCPLPVNEALTGKVRLLNNFSTSDILFKNIEKRDLSTVTKHLDKAYPNSDDFSDVDTPAYLVIKDADNALELKADKNIDASTNTITTNFPEDYLVKIPLEHKKSSSTETNVITASAVINGEKKYGILKEIEEESDFDSVYVDIRDFSDDPESLDSIDLSLYYESAGVSDLNFISDPLNVTIQLGDKKPAQIIEFNENQLKDAIYGEEITLTSRLTSSLATQSDADIVYKIESGNAVITKKSYDPMTGIATAKIKPINGIGDVTVSINKAGNENVAAAKEQTYTFSLTKKNITITSESYERDVGDDEPAYSIKAGEDDLVIGDEIPPGIKATTSYAATDGKLTTLTSGTDITIDEDTSDEVQKFKDKYEITYVKGTLIVKVGDNWLDISPPPNSDGWNSSDVTVKPSADAMNAGYTKISLNGGSQDDSITIDTDRKKEELKFILHKETGETTNEISLTRDIRIDKTVPELVIKVEDIPTTFFSRLLNAFSGQDAFYKDGFLVTITATDEESGIKDITSPDGTGTITESGNTKTLTFTVTKDFKGKISANAVNNAGLSTTETSEQIINENDNSKMSIQTTNISGHVNASDVFEAALDFNVTAKQSGLKAVYYSIDGGEEKTLKSYTSTDAEDASLTLTDSLVISLTDIIQNAPVDTDTLTITIKIITNSGNVLSKDVSVHYDVTAAEISLITVTDENTWAFSKRVDFSVNEEGSGIKSVTVTKPDGTPAAVNGVLTQNSFDFTVYETGTYTILVIDNAGNESMKVSKNITKIDPDAPVIKDVNIAPENTEWSKKKTITFHVSDIVNPDSGSGVDPDSIQVKTDGGDNPEISCQGNKDDLTCTFDTLREDKYTIEAKDGAGNEAIKETVEVEKIDTTDLEITDIRNDGSGESDPWEMKERVISFKAGVGTSGLKGTPSVILNGTPVTVTALVDGNYSFIATENGDYTITIESVAGQKKEVNGSVSKIDKEPPLINELKVEQSSDFTKPDSRVKVSFHVVDQPDTDASGITSVYYVYEGTEVLLSEEEGSYSFISSTNGDYEIKAVDIAGNESVEKLRIGLPVITKNMKNVQVYEGEALDISLETDLHDSIAVGRSYEWFFIDEEGTFTSIKKEALPDTETEQTIPFVYDKADGSHSGMYRCLIMNGDGYYRWSNVFVLTVITDPVSGLIMIPTNIDMTKSAESDHAEAEFEIGLYDGVDIATPPKHMFQVQAPVNVVLEHSETKDTYVATLQKEKDGSYEPYESGNLAELSYKGAMKQKAKLVMPVHLYHDPGTYQGVLRFTIRYGEGGTKK